MSRAQQQAKQRRTEEQRQERERIEREATVERQTRELAHLDAIRGQEGDLYRAQLIERIANASSRACPPIVPALHGGFAYQQKDGSTVGRRHPTAEAAAAAWKATEEGNSRHFAAQLREMSDGEIACQAGFWLKVAP